MLLEILGLDPEGKYGLRITPQLQIRPDGLFPGEGDQEAYEAFEEKLTMAVGDAFKDWLEDQDLEQLHAQLYEQPPKGHHDDVEVD